MSPIRARKISDGRTKAKSSKKQDRWNQIESKLIQIKAENEQIRANLALD